MNEFHFLRPYALVGLPLVLMLAWFYGRRHLGAGRWLQWVDPALIPFVLTGHDASRGRGLMSVLSAIIVGLLLVALAGPVFERLPQPVYRNEQALVIALDLSRSMNAQDILPTRLVRARLKIRDLLEQRVEGETALLVFAGDAFTVSPLTDDTGTITALLGALTTEIMPRQGSNIAPALLQADRLLTQAGADGGHVLLVTDGVADRPAAVRAASTMAERNVTVSVLALGTPEGEVVRTGNGDLVKDRRGQIVVARLDSGALASVSAAGNGRYVTLSADDSDVDALLAPSEEFLIDGRMDEDLQTDVWREEGPLIVLLCLPFVALFFRRGWVACMAVLMIAPPPPAQADIWSDLWSRREQQGAQMFADGQFAAAAGVFRDAEWRAAAAYRAGDYDGSAEALSDLDHPDAHYNRGNALAMAERFPEARAAYMAALAIDPEHEDARYNLDLLNKQQPQDSGDPNDQSQQNDPGDSASGEPQDQDGAPQDFAANQDRQQAGQEGEADAPDSDQGPDGQSGESDDEAGRDRQEQQAAEQGERDGEDGPPQGMSDAELERDLAAEQWLRQIPDDPGGLLRRKFRRQYSQRYREHPPEEQEW